MLEVPKAEVISFTEEKESENNDAIIVPSNDKCESYN